MIFGFGGVLLVLGILGAANLIIAKIPSARDLITKLAPYQGWLGVVAAIWGLYGLVWTVTSMGLMAVNPPWGLIVWILSLATDICLIGLGILFGVGVAKTFVKDAAAQARMDQMVTKLTPFQGILGIAAIGVSAASLVLNILF